MAILLYELVGRDPERPFSPHCWKVRLALRHKGLSFQTVPVPFTGVPSIEGGSGIVPVLRDGETVVSDSFAIAEYLESAYPHAPSLFGGEGGRYLSRFVESWSQRTIHPVVGGLALLDIHQSLDPADQAYFRESRETRMGKTLEAVVEGREQRVAPFLQQLEPLRALLCAQPFLGGPDPLFADYVVFGAFQWLRVTTSLPVLSTDDPIAAWFERCLDLHGGEGRTVPAAA